MMNEFSRSLLARAVLGFVRGSVLLVFGMAILLGVLFLLPGPGAWSEPARFRDFDVTEEFMTLRATMRTHRKVGMSTLILHEESGREMMRSGYDHFGKLKYFTSVNDGIRTRVRARDDGSVQLSFEGPTSTTEVECRRDGSSEVAVTRRDALRTPLGQVVISPEGRASNVAVVP